MSQQINDANNSTEQCVASDLFMDWWMSATDACWRYREINVPNTIDGWVFVSLRDDYPNMPKGAIYLDHIAALRTGKGNGSVVLELLCKKADEYAAGSWLARHLHTSAWDELFASACRTLKTGKTNGQESRRIKPWHAGPPCNGSMTMPRNIRRIHRRQCRSGGRRRQYRRAL